ncbi:MAG: hypothetical protein GY795_50080 [Desulfobacterales bacterium]|nr:hypothetical protein [Desulfobacterales bacterium]
MVGYPDGRVDIYEYEKCTSEEGYPGEYVKDSSGEEFCNIVTHRYGTVSENTGAETLSAETTGKTARDVTVSSSLGSVLLNETLVYNDGAYEPVRWTVYENDDMGRPVKTVSSDGTVTRTEWDCCRRLWEEDARGILTTYNSDDLNRLESVVVTETDEDGNPAEITTEYTYDAEGRQLTRTVSSGSLSLKTADSKYDGAGRLKSSTDRAGLETKYQSTDRISESRTEYVKIGTDWWEKTVRKVYKDENSSVSKPAGTQMARLTGLGTVEPRYEEYGILTAYSVYRYP